MDNPVPERSSFDIPLFRITNDEFPICPMLI